MVGRHKDLSGQKFGRLTVIREVGKDKHGNYINLCLCDCGKEIQVISHDILRGHTRSCGCLASEIIGKRNKLYSTTHGLRRKTKLYQVWVNMKSRCYNVNHNSYKTYGARGIKVCDEWRNDFQAFYDWAMANGYDETAIKWEYTVDRIDVNGNYAPSNCRWITIQEQQNNKRSNRLVTYKGETLNITQMAKKYNMTDGCLYRRLKKGMTIKEAIETPVRKRLKRCLS